MLRLKQTSKQSQLVDQNFSNGIMLNALAALENLAFFYGYRGNKIFDYYSGDARENENSLIDAVILQLTIFRNSHLNYNSNYSTYDFPHNLTKKQIVEYILTLKQFVPLQSQIYYSEIVKYLDGNSNILGIEQKIKEKMKEWGPTKKEDLLKVSRASPYTNSYMFDEMNKVKDGYNKTGDFQIYAKLNDKKGNNQLQNNLHQSEKTLAKQLEQINKSEVEINNGFENIFEKVNAKEDVTQDIQELKNNIKNLEKSLGLVEIESKEIAQKTQNYQNIFNEFQKINCPQINEIIKNLVEKIIGLYQSNGKVGPPL